MKKMKRQTSHLRKLQRARGGDFNVEVANVPDNESLMRYYFIFSKQPRQKKTCLRNLLLAGIGQDTHFQHTTVNIFLLIRFNISFGCAKEPSH